MQQTRAKAVVEHYSYHPERGASKRIGVLRARRLFVDTPKARQHIDLVGKGDRDRHRISRREIIRAERLVVIFDCARDGFVLALREGVVLPHQSLQLGEFADHSADEIGLGEPRRALARNVSSNAPISTVGHSTRPATSANRPGSSMSSKPCANARFLASARMISARRAGSSMTLALWSLAT